MSRHSNRPNFPFPTKRQIRNLSKYTNIELREHIEEIQDYWTILETEMKRRLGQI